MVRDLSSFVEEVVDTLPPLTEEQKKRFSALFQGALNDD